MSESYKTAKEREISALSQENAKLKKKIEKLEREQENKEWEAHEDGHKEGYESGVVDFAEVERRKQKLRAKGIPVIGDIKMYEKTRQKLISMVKKIRETYIIFGDSSVKDFEEMIKELEELECPVYEVV